MENLMITVILSLLTLIAGLVGGCFLHILVMKINFQQKMIDNKIKIFESLITIWIRMREQLVHKENGDGRWFELDKFYGESLRYLAGAILVSDNNALVLDIDTFNENFYRQKWFNLSEDEINKKLDDLKKEGMKLIPRMRDDIQESARIAALFGKKSNKNIT